MIPPARLQTVPHPPDETPINAPTSKQSNGLMSRPLGENTDMSREGKKSSRRTHVLVAGNLAKRWARQMSCKARLTPGVLCADDDADFLSSPGHRNRDQFGPLRAGGCPETNSGLRHLVGPVTVSPCREIL